MKKSFFLLLFLTSFGCGSEDPFARENKIKSRLIGNLNGDYYLKESECGTIFESFKISQDSAPEEGEEVEAVLTIKNDGGAPGIDEGDKFQDVTISIGNFFLFSEIDSPAYPSNVTVAALVDDIESVLPENWEALLDALEQN